MGNETIHILECIGLQTPCMLDTILFTLRKTSWCLAKFLEPWFHYNKYIVLDITGKYKEWNRSWESDKN